MNNKSLVAILNCALALSLLLSVIFCLKYVFRSRQMLSIRGQATFINSYRATMQALASECQAYSEKNRAIVPILESVGIPTKAAAAKQPATR